MTLDSTGIYSIFCVPGLLGRVGFPAAETEQQCYILKHVRIVISSNWLITVPSPFMLSPGPSQRFPFLLRRVCSASRPSSRSALPPATMPPWHSIFSDYFPPSPGLICTTRHFSPWLWNRLLNLLAQVYCYDGVARSKFEPPRVLEVRPTL